MFKTLTIRYNSKKQKKSLLKKIQYKNQQDGEKVKKRGKIKRKKEKKKI